MGITYDIGIPGSRSSSLPPPTIGDPKNLPLLGMLLPNSPNLYGLWVLLVATLALVGGGVA